MPVTSFYSRRLAFLFLPFPFLFLFRAVQMQQAAAVLIIITTRPSRRRGATSVPSRDWVGGVIVVVAVEMAGRE